VWLDGLCQRKIPMTPWGFKPVASQLVAQYLNQLCHPVPHKHTLLTLHLPALIMVRTFVTYTSSAQDLNCTTANTEHKMSHWKNAHKLKFPVCYLKLFNCSHHVSYTYRVGVQPLPPPAMAFYIFSQEIHLMNFLRHAAQTVFISTKCCVFHNVIFFWFIKYSLLHKECAKIQCLNLSLKFSKY